jgi:ABC-3C biological conflict system middle component
MKPWSERPPEVAHLFNPAFCALLLREAIRGFAEVSPSGMPHPLVFLLLPIVLHKATRESLPGSITTKMHPWLQEHQEARIGFCERCAAILPHTREAILFAMNAQMVTLSQDGSMQAPRLRLKQLPWPSDSESAACRKRAHFVGRWLALAGDNATIFAMWGVRP